MRNIEINKHRYKGAKDAYFKELFYWLLKQKKLWEAANNPAGRTKSDQSHTALTTAENIKLVDDMNRHFIKVGAYEPGAESSRNNNEVITEVSETIFLRPSDLNKVIAVTKKLKRNVAAGIDGITSNAVIHFAHEN